MTGYKNPPRRRSDVSHITTCDAIQAQLRADYVLLGTWKRVGEKFGISGGMAQRVAMTKYRPRDIEIRRRLGLVKPRPGRLAQRSRKLALDVLRIIYG